MAEATNSTCPISKGVILCVDDDPMILRYEKTLLEVSGYTVLAASSGKDALRFVTTCAFDVVILDYGMPEMSGHEVALEIRRVRPGLAIILMSGVDVPTDVLALVDAFVVKVEAWQKLLPTLADLCSRISPSRTHAQQSQRSASRRGPSLGGGLNLGDENRHRRGAGCACLPDSNRPHFNPTTAGRGQRYSP